MKIKDTDRHFTCTSHDIEPFGPDSVLKPIGSLAQTIQATSAGDMLLFMIALNRKEEQEKNLTNPKSVIDIS